ncbi:hypothetical protein T10_11785 [Trichinella papuae]|uniref:Uncharacterized protein n=1 Tax=Trichinella papuae TaxID=268474 RepID=A0A0V1MGP4_9BILA|nr:hypothetical protein T10_11785 [Trichinella papuae]
MFGWWLVSIPGHGRVMKDSTFSAAQTASSMFSKCLCFTSRTSSGQSSVLRNLSSPMNLWRHLTASGTPFPTDVEYHDQCLTTIPAHAFYSSPTKRDRRLRCSGDPIVLSMKSCNFRMKTSRSLRQRLRSVLTIHPNPLNRRSAPEQLSPCHEQ